MNLTSVDVGVWACECGESLSGQFSFPGEKIDQEQRALMTKWDLKLVTYVTSPRDRHACTSTGTCLFPRQEVT